MGSQACLVRARRRGAPVSPQHSSTNAAILRVRRSGLTRSFDDHPAPPVGRQGGYLERDIGPERGPPNDCVLELEMVEQRHRLAGELGHRVAADESSRAGNSTVVRGPCPWMV
jgi:hypothetical protein